MIEQELKSRQGGEIQREDLKSTMVEEQFEARNSGKIQNLSW